MITKTECLVFYAWITHFNLCFSLCSLIHLKKKFYIPSSEVRSVCMLIWYFKQQKKRKFKYLNMEVLETHIIIIYRGISTNICWWSLFSESLKLFYDLPFVKWSIYLFLLKLLWLNHWSLYILIIFTTHILLIFTKVINFYCMVTFPPLLLKRAGEYLFKFNHCNCFDVLFSNTFIGHVVDNLILLRLIDCDKNFCFAFISKFCNQNRWHIQKRNVYRIGDILSKQCVYYEVYLF